MITGHGIQATGGSPSATGSSRKKCVGLWSWRDLGPAARWVGSPSSTGSWPGIPRPTSSDGRRDLDSPPPVQPQTIYVADKSMGTRPRLLQFLTIKQEEASPRPAGWTLWRKDSPRRGQLRTLTRRQAQPGWPRTLGAEEASRASRPHQDCAQRLPGGLLWMEAPSSRQKTAAGCTAGTDTDSGWGSTTEKRSPS